MQLLDLLKEMHSHAEAERQAIRQLDSRRLFELATTSDQQTLRLSKLLEQADPASKDWEDVRALAASVRALSNANAELMRRSLELIRAARPSSTFHDAPAFVSRVA